MKKFSSMNPFLTTLTLLIASLLPGMAQTNSDQPTTKPKWTEEDRKYLLDNLIKSKEELRNETENLTQEQWNFKESPDRWSINQIVEHLAIWELLFTHEISVSLQIGPIPNFPNHLPDSLFLNEDPESLKPKNARDFTKPFSYTVPLGNHSGKDNLAWITHMRDESIKFVKNETRDLRAHYINFGPNIHQNLLMVFTHNYRHLGQIRKIKARPDYPDE
ncbi:MAG: DinB family protein [Bacteroidota bacterium]